MKKYFILSLILISVLASVASAENGVDKSMIRFHVVANSDDPSDIEIKEKIAEILYRELKKESFDSIEAAEKYIMYNKGRFEKIADSYLKEAGVNYVANAYYGVKHYNSRTLYGNLYKEGNYKSLVISLGKGEGHNFWSVLYPSYAGKIAKTKDNGGKRFIFVNKGKIRSFGLYFYDILKRF